MTSRVERLVSVRERIAAYENGQLSMQLSRPKTNSRLNHVNNIINTAQQKASNNSIPSPGTVTVTPTERSVATESLPTLSRHSPPHADQSYDQNAVEKGQYRKDVQFPTLNLAKSTKISPENEDKNGRTPATLRNGAPRVNVRTSVTAKEPRTFAHLEQNKMVVRNPSSGNTISVTSGVPTRSRSAYNIADDSFCNGEKTTSAPVLSISKDTATQTIIRKAEPIALPRIITTSTQTDYLITAHLESKAERRRKHELEEQKQLMKLIVEARAETIDRYSRIRTSQIIANSARKQTQIWRDTKDFIAGVLLPEAVRLANQSRHEKKTAAEIVARIRFYP